MHTTTVIPPQRIPGRYEPAALTSRQQEVEDLEKMLFPEDPTPEFVSIEFAYHLSSLDGDPFQTVAHIEEELGYPLACPPDYGHDALPDAAPIYDSILAHIILGDHNHV